MTYNSIPNIDIFWEIDYFVIKSDIFKGVFNFKNILNKLSRYHNNYFKYSMFGKYSGFAMHVSRFLVNKSDIERLLDNVLFETRPGVTGNLAPQKFGLAGPNFLGNLAPPGHIS
jgi:hypothetical protein